MNDPNQWCLYDGYMALYVVQKFIFTALTLSCSVPGGIDIPTFALGAVFGQLYVSVLLKLLDFFSPEGSSVIQCKSSFVLLIPCFIKFEASTQSLVVLQWLVASLDQCRLP